MKGMRHILWFCALLLMGSIWACTEVDLVDMSSRPNTSLLRMMFNWNGEDADKPERLHVVAMRNVMTWRAHGYVETDDGRNPWFGFTEPLLEDGNGGENEENGTTPDTATVASDSTTAVTPDTVPETEPGTRYAFRLKGGKYNMLTVNSAPASDNIELRCLAEGEKFSELTDEETHLSNYLTNNQRFTNELYLYITPLHDRPVIVKEKDLPDFNPKFDYITDVPRIFYGIASEVDAVPGIDTEVTMDMQPISQEVQVVFTIELEGNIKLLEKPIVELSGICGHFNLLKEYVDTTELYRSAVIAEPESQSGNLHIYKARFHTLGIVPSADPSYLLGPGIFQVAVKATSTSPENTDTVGRYIYAGINPYTELTESEIIVIGPDGKPRLRTSREPVIVNVEKHLVIKENFLINPGNGLDWEQHDPDNDLTIEM